MTFWRNSISRAEFGQSPNHGRSIVDVIVGELAQLQREPVVVGFFAGMKAEVFDEQHFAGAQRVRFFLRLRADAVIRPLHIRAEELRERFANGRERVFVLALTFRAAEVRGDDDARAGVAEDAQSRQRFFDARGVGDARAIERHVVIDAIEDARVFWEAEVVKGADLDHESKAEC